MKKTSILILLTALGMAACSAPQGAGFSGIGAEPTTADAPSVLSGGTGYGTGNGLTTDYRQAYVSGASASPVTTRAAQSVLQRNDVPFTRIESRSAPNSNPDIALMTASRSAMSYGSSRWGAQHATPIAFGDAQARLKAVSVDGMTFGVVGKLKRPFVGQRMSDAQLGEAAVAEVTRRSGCSYGGRTFTLRDQYKSIVRLGVLLNC